MRFNRAYLMQWLGLVDIISLFHHVHHVRHPHGIHRVHHAGGRHAGVEAGLNYKIRHCKCRKHQINKEYAIGYGMNENLETVEVKIRFVEKCREGGWHVESGIKE